MKVGTSAEVDEFILQVTRHWPKLHELPGFAVAQSGFGDSNGGFGLEYPNDLDDYAREVEKRFIPDGWVEMYGFWGPEKGGYEFQVEEKTYLVCLARILRAADLRRDALLVESLFRLTP